MCNINLNKQNKTLYTRTIVVINMQSKIYEAQIIKIK